MPGLGLLPNHHLLPPAPQHLASLQPSAVPPPAPANKTLSGHSLTSATNHHSKYKPSGFKLNLGLSKWCSMHLAIAMEIRNQQGRTGNSVQTPEKPLSIEQQKSSGSSSNKSSRGDPLTSISYPQSNGITTSSHSKTVPSPASIASVTSTISSNVPSSLAHLPPHLSALQPMHGLGHLPNAQFPSLPFPVLPNQIDAMKNMNSLFNLPPGMPPHHPAHLNPLTTSAKSLANSTAMNNHTTTVSSSGGLPTTPMTSMTSTLTRFPPFPGTPALKGADMLTPPSSTQSALNSSSSLSSPLTNPFLRPPGLFQSPFNLPTTSLPGTHTSAASIPPSPVLTSALPPVSQPPNGSGRLTPSAMFANEMWSRARMFSPLMNPGLGWSPLKSADAAQKQLSTSNNSTGKMAKESQSKSSSSIKQSPSILPMNNSLNQPPSSFHPQPRPPSRLNLNSSQQQKQQQQQQSSKPNYKREHSQSPSSRHAQYPAQSGFNSSPLYHPSNKMPKLAESPLLPAKGSAALTPTTSLPSSVIPSMAGLHPPPPITNGFNVPPHHLLPYAGLNNSGLNSSATNPANRLPISSSASMPGIASLSAAHQPTNHLNSSIAAAAAAAKHKGLENASQLAQTNGLPGSTFPPGLLPPSLANATPAELALLHNDSLAIERAKYLSMLSTLPSAGLPGSAANPLMNPLLHPRLSTASGLPPGMHPAGLPPGMHPGLVSSSEMQAASDTMKYLNSAAMFSGLPPGLPGLVQPPMLPPDLANPFKSLTDFTRSGFGERELFSRYSILSNAGGGNPLTEKIGKN